MDLNINNYNINELIGLMNLPKKDNYDLIELQKATIPNLKIIIGSKNVEGIDKNTIFNFYKDAFIKLAQLLNINVPQFVKEEVEVILCMLDATRLEQSLAFGMQVMQLVDQYKKKVLFVLNMMEQCTYRMKAEVYLLHFWNSNTKE